MKETRRNNDSRITESREGKEMASQQEREELDARARQGETVVRGGTGGKSLEAQEHLAEGILVFIILHGSSVKAEHF